MKLVFNLTDYACEWERFKKSEGIYISDIDSSVRGMCDGVHIGIAELTYENVESETFSFSILLTIDIKDISVMRLLSKKGSI